MGVEVLPGGMAAKVTLSLVIPTSSCSFRESLATV